MSHGVIITVQLRHEYYASGLCPDFVIEPDEATERVLRGHRCVSVPMTGGIRILTELDEVGRAFLPLAAGTLLRFRLTLRNPDFVLYTELPKRGAGSEPLPLFPSGDAVKDLKLVVRDWRNQTQERGAEALTASGGSRDPLADYRPGEFIVSADSPGPLRNVGAEAFIELQAPAPGSNGEPQLHSVELAWKAKRVRWAYYCLTNLRADEGELQIVDSAPPQGEEALRFGPANRTDLKAQPDPADPIAQQLAQQHPELRCVRMLSDQAIACRQQHKRVLELRLGGERLAGPLPLPALDSLAREDLLYRVVRHRHPSFANP